MTLRPANRAILTIDGSRYSSSGKIVRQAGALRKSAESLGKHAAKQLLDELASGATLDRFAADQIIPFAALASGESRFIIPAVTDHVLTSAWLAETFLDARVRTHGQRLMIPVPDSGKVRMLIARVEVGGRLSVLP